MALPSTSAVYLKAMIEHAIADEKITPEEREQIMMLADAEGITGSIARHDPKWCYQVGLALGVSGF